MAPPRKFLVVFTLLLVVGLAGLVSQNHANASLRRELAHRQAEAREQRRLEAEHRRLQLAQVPPEQLAAREQERARLAVLANELEILRRRAEGESPTPPADVRRLALPKSFSAAEQWTNAGDRDARSALETALWASAHGEMSTLVRLLSIEESTRERVGVLLARLPEGARSELGSPEQAIAMVTANAIPLGGARVVAQFNDTPDSTRIRVQLIDLDGKLRERIITLRASSEGWRLAVPDAAIDRYVASLRKPAGP